MFALEIINALNDPDNPAKVEGLNAKLKAAPPEDADAKANRESFYQYEKEKAAAALTIREERNISHYASGRFRY